MKSKWLPVGLVIALQVTWMVGTSLVQERSLVQGKVVLLETRPVDPRDLLRGDFVILGYKINDVPASLFSPPLAGGLLPGSTVYVALAPRGKFHELVRASTRKLKAAGEEVVLKGTARYQWDSPPLSQVRVEYGLERYYVSEGSGNAQGKVTVEVAVASSQKGIIKQVYVDGVPYTDAVKAQADGSRIGSTGSGRASARSTGPVTRAILAKQIRPRDPQADKNLIDLSNYYNALLTNSWELASGEETIRKDLSELPQGLQTLAGTRFDVRGIVQLHSPRLAQGAYPQAIRGIKAGVKCSKLHFLHGTRLAAGAGTRIGSIIIHYADAQQASVPIVFGENVRDWRAPGACGNAVVAWSATNTTSRIGLYKCGWLNERPEIEITTLDYVSEWTDSAPFLIAITAD